MGQFMTPNSQPSGHMSAKPPMMESANNMRLLRVEVCGGSLRTLSVARSFRPVRTTSKWVSCRLLTQTLDGRRGLQYRPYCREQRQERLGTFIFAE